MTIKITITPGDPRAPEALALLAASHALMAARYPPEHTYQLDADALAGPGVNFLVARIGDRAVGCGAVATANGHGEIKSMFVAPAARRSGLGLRLLAALEGGARDAGPPMPYLETGIHEAAAIGLYEKAGFRRRGAFGDYKENPPQRVHGKAAGVMAVRGLQFTHVPDSIRDLAPLRPAHRGPGARPGSGGGN